MYRQNIRISYNYDDIGQKHTEYNDAQTKIYAKSGYTKCNK